MQNKTKHLFNSHQTEQNEPNIDKNFRDGIG